MPNHHVLLTQTKCIGKHHGDENKFKKNKLQNKEMLSLGFCSKTYLTNIYHGHWVGMIA